MEIIDYLRIARRRLWVLVLVPVLAALAVAAVVLTRPPVYTATAVVAAPALVGGQPTYQYSGSQGANEFVAAFGAAATSPPVVNAVARAHHITSDTVVSGLTTAQLGSSPLINVTYSSTSKAQAGPVAHDDAARTLSFLFGSQVALAQKQVDNAAAAASAANDGLQALIRSNGAADPVEVYKARLQQVSSLESQQLTLRAQGKPAAAAALGSALNGLRARLTALNPVVTRYQDLTAAKTAAAANLDRAQQALQSVQAQAAAADPAKVVTVGATAPASLSSTLLKKGLPAVGAGLFLAVGLVAVLEMLSRRRTVAAATAQPIAATAPRTRTAADVLAAEPR